MRQFRAPSFNVRVEDLVEWGTTLTFGVPPRRIDVLNWISGLDWEDADHDAESEFLESVPVRFLSLRVWRKNKEAADREHDREDLRKLKNRIDR